MPPRHRGFQPLGECRPVKRISPQAVLATGGSAAPERDPFPHPAGLLSHRSTKYTCHPERSEGSAVIAIPRKNSAPLWFGEGTSSRGCGKTPLRSGLGKGTSSTRAVRTAPQRRLPAAEGMPPCKTNFSASCWFPVPQIYQIYLSSRAKLRSALVWGRARVPLVP